ncbi:MAG: hypothetical protein AAF916_12435, partial [Planctomycetota bacterium]
IRWKNSDPPEGAAERLAEQVRSAEDKLGQWVAQDHGSGPFDHAVLALLMLVEDGDELSDVLEERLEDAVEETFGRQVLRAAMRGRLVVEDTETSSRPTQTGAAAEPTGGSQSAVETSETPPPDAAGTPAAMRVVAPNRSNAPEPVVPEPVVPEPVVSEPVVSEPVAIKPVAAEPAVTEKYVEPIDVQDYDDFASTHHFVDADDVRRSAGMSDPAGLEASIASVLGERLCEGKVGHVAIFCGAIEAIGSTAPVHPDDLESLRLLVDGGPGWTAEAEAAYDRLAAIRRSVDAGTDPPDGVAVPLLIAGLAGAAEHPLSDGDIDRIIAAHFGEDDALGEFLRKLLKVRPGQRLNLEQWRARLCDLDEPVDHQSVAAEAERAVRELRKYLTEQWSAAAGRIQHTHCRNAWLKFIHHASPELDKIFAAGAGKIELNVDVMRRNLRRLNPVSKEIFDRGDVKHNDRKTADRTVAKIRALATDAVERLETVARLRRESPADAFERLPKKELQTILRRDDGLNGFDHLVALGLKMVFADHTPTK